MKAPLVENLLAANPYNRIVERASRLAVFLMACSFAVGCVTPKRTGFMVPRRCININVQSFTRPCVQREDGKLVCDGVVVTANCVQAAR